VNKNLLIFGNTELAEVSYFYFDKFSDYNIKGFVVDEEYFDSKKFLGKNNYVTSEITNNNFKNDNNIFLAIGYSKNNLIRTEKYNYFKKSGFNFASFISDKSSIFTNLIGENCFILEDNTIQPFTSVGNNTILWSGNHIGHHSKIGNNCFISSHVVISGNCIVGDNTFIGVNSSIADRTNIGKSCFIGMGVNITKDIDDEAKVTIKNNSQYL